MNLDRRMSGTKSPAILSRRRLSRSALPETPRRGVVNDLHKVCLVTGQGTERPVQDFLHRRYGRFASRPSSHDVTGDIIDRESIREVVVVNVSGSKYSVVSLVAEELGMFVTRNNSDECDLLWVDSTFSTEQYLELKNYQVVNHFPGMAAICRKDSLGRNMEKLKKFHSKEYSFVPHTWVLPSERSGLCCHIRDLKRRQMVKTFIVKPCNAAMGNGIFLTQSIEGIPKDHNCVVQEYVEKPFLLDGFKIDLRVYVLVTSCNPLRIFIYNDGLVRLSTLAYHPPIESNLDQHFMHLTNYSINKHNRNFDHSEERDHGSKRTIQYFTGWLTRNGYNASEMWGKINDIVVKTLLATSPHLIHSYNACRPGRNLDKKSQCFEVLGFDILLDENLSPWLLEVNRSPSFATGSKLDLEIKSGVIKDAFNIINLRPSDRKREVDFQRKASRQRLFHSPSLCSRRFDFRFGHDVASYQHIRKKGELQCCLGQMRRERDQYEHEQKVMGGYMRAYPCSDYAKAELYETLIQAAVYITQPGSKNGYGFCGVQDGSRYRDTCPLQKLKEHELLNLLSQYEGEEHSSITVPSSSVTFKTPSYIAYQPFSLDTNTPMDAMYRVMAARVSKEEQTQRVMIALNETKPSYPGRTDEEIGTLLDKWNTNRSTHTPKMAEFWMVTLDSGQRRQLLVPLKELVKSILHSYWKNSNLSKVHLYQVFNKLFNFMLYRGGLGLWTAIANDKSWESLFTEKSYVISVIEMICCRRIVELSKTTVILAFYNHYLKPQKARLRNHRIFSCTPKISGPLTIKNPSKILSLTPPTASYRILHSRRSCPSNIKDHRQHPSQLRLPLKT